ncbi:hypothetical protein ABPG77_002793 [Micractinium sp. CCAP 211/92]
MARPSMTRGAALLLAAIAAAVLPACNAAASGYSDLWGKNGELWDPTKLPDFSYAGYRQGNEPLPEPPVTRNVTDFRKSGMSDTEMLQAALAWAHKQPDTDFTVLYIPPGQYTLTDVLYIRRSRLVLRGAGRTKTTLYIPKSLTDLFGPSKESGTGGYVNFGAFVSISGPDGRMPKLAKVLSGAQGTRTIQVDNASKLQVGQYYELLFTDVDGKFNNLMFDNEYVAPPQYKNQTRVKLITKIKAIQGESVELERLLPYSIKAGVDEVDIAERYPTVHDSGVEGITFKFKWEWYGGHHCEKGWNAVEVRSAYDCWIRNIATWNADSGILMNDASSVTVDGIKMQVTKTRKNHLPNKFHEYTWSDGHWGVQHTHSFDVLVMHFDIRCAMMHDVGTGSSGKFGVYMNGKCTDGNLDLHRALAGPTLYTNIDVGLGTDALHSGGPSRSGPNALAGTTWWGIRSAHAVDWPQSNKPAGSCAFGPVINLVDVNIKRSEVRHMCKTWHYERSIKGPSNLYYAQLALRKRREAAEAAAPAQQH